MIEAENTDAPGVLAALPESPGGRRALVLGAGGSARAVVWALVQAGAADVQVWNRTPARARELCEAVGGRPVEDPEPAELLLNCTAAGLEPGADPFKELPVAADDVGGYRCVVDLVYREVETAIVAAAAARGVPVVDGLEVLVRQGALSFERWTGRPPPLASMREGAREH
jgi:shikimate dehydrogenase